MSTTIVHLQGRLHQRSISTVDTYDFKVLYHLNMQSQQEPP